MNSRILTLSPLTRAARTVARVAVLAILVGLAVGQGGLSAHQGTDTVPAWRPVDSLESEVREQLSERWFVLPGDIVLEWGEPRGGSLPPNLTEVELLGSGRDGHWVVSFGSIGPDAEKRSVHLRAGVMVPKRVANRPFERGEVVAEGDMTSEPRLNWGAPKLRKAPCEAGWVAQRQIESGEELTSPAVKPPVLVFSGKPVTILWTQGNVDVRLRGTAAGSAGKGQRVFVRTESGTRLDGLVEGPALVRISANQMESGR